MFVNWKVSSRVYGLSVLHSRNRMGSDGSPDVPVFWVKYLPKQWEWQLLLQHRAVFRNLFFKFSMSTLPFKFLVSKVTSASGLFPIKENLWIAGSPIPIVQPIALNSICKTRVLWPQFRHNTELSLAWSHSPPRCSRQEWVHFSCHHSFASVENTSLWLNALHTWCLVTLRV